LDGQRQRDRLGTGHGHTHGLILVRQDDLDGFHTHRVVLKIGLYGCTPCLLDGCGKDFVLCSDAKAQVRSHRLFVFQLTKIFPRITGSRMIASASSKLIQSIRLALSRGVHVRATDLFTAPQRLDHPIVGRGVLQLDVPANCIEQRAPIGDVQIETDVLRTQVPCDVVHGVHGNEAQFHSQRRTRNQRRLRITTVLLRPRTLIRLIHCA